MQQLSVSYFTVPTCVCSYFKPSCVDRYRLLCCRMTKTEREVLRRMRLEGEAAAKFHLRLAKFYACEERKADAKELKCKRAAARAARKVEKEAAESRRKAALAANPTLRWRHPRRKGWLPPEGYRR